MKINVTPDALRAVASFTRPDVLEAYIDLMAQCIDLALSDDVFPDDMDGRVFGRTARSLQRDLQNLLLAARIPDNEKGGSNE